MDFPMVRGQGSVTTETKVVIVGSKDDDLSAEGGVGPGNHGRHVSGLEHSGFDCRGERRFPALLCRSPDVVGPGR